MAKTETPAEVSENVQPPRLAHGVLSVPASPVEPRPLVAARRSLLEGAADTLVGRHHDLDAMDALDDLLDGEGYAVNPSNVRQHAEPGRIFRPHAGQYDRSEDDTSESNTSESNTSENDISGNDASKAARADERPSDDGEPGPVHVRARAYLRREDLDAALLDDEDVIDEAEQAVRSDADPYEAGAYEAGASEAGACESPTFGLPRVGVARAGARGAPKVPQATLEQPSSSRLELTPSPVPRVSLTPATGAVDISLVPGPNGSRNMPTLAAQHLLGRRQQRRPAAAATVPPPSTTAREPRIGMDLARDVRSSRREVVLGLSIGLVLSVVLAGVGQAYLREPTVADMGAPGELQSITLSARPDVPSADPGAAPVGPASDGSRRSPGVDEGQGTAASAPAAEPSSSVARATRPGGSDPSLDPAFAARSARSTGKQAAPFAVALNDDPEAALFAKAGAPSRAAERATRGAPERATRALVARSRKPSLIATHPPPFELERVPVAGRSPDGKSTEARSAEGRGKAFESSSAPAQRAPLSPAESAGLGLDLPL